MGLNIGGATLAVSGSGVNLTNLAALSISYLNNGTIANVNNCSFVAYNTTATWTYPAAAGTWTKILAPNTASNVSACYNTSLSRFTAPTTGAYLFKANSPNIFTTTNSDYCHPVFGINGSTAGRRPNGVTPYRIQGYGMLGGYWRDTETSEIIWLTAGDYVEFYCYQHTTGVGYYPVYTVFSGTFLG